MPFFRQNLAFPFPSELFIDKPGRTNHVFLSVSIPWHFLQPLTIQINSKCGLSEKVNILIKLLSGILRLILADLSLLLAGPKVELVCMVN